MFDLGDARNLEHKGGRSLRFWTKLGSKLAKALLRKAMPGRLKIDLPKRTTRRLPTMDLLGIWARSRLVRLIVGVNQIHVEMMICSTKIICRWIWILFLEQMTIG